MWTDARRLAPTHFQLSIDNCRLGPVHLHQIGIRQLAIEKSSLVPEVPDAREDHSHAVAVGGFNDFLVPDRAAGLNNRGRSGLGDLFYTVGEGPFRGNCAFITPILHESTRLIWPAPTPTV